MFNRWKKFDRYILNTMPKKDGWYICTVEVKNQQRYVMDLYWYCNKQKFISNGVAHIFDIFDVYDNGKKISDWKTDRTKGVVAWKKPPKAYMKGFKYEPISIR